MRIPIIVLVVFLLSGCASPDWWGTIGPEVPPGAGAVVNLSETGDLKQAAARLFAALHELDRPDFKAIAVMPVPDEGLGAAINDRLRRAAAPRSM